MMYILFLYYIKKIEYIKDMDLNLVYEKIVLFILF
jgi:hypothetical protein